jgi:PAS domain S-box-containing protein
MKDQERTKEQHTNELMKLRQRIAELEKLKDKYQQVEKDLKYRERLEKIITTISTNFISLSLDKIDNGINQALKKIGNFVGADRSYVFLFSKDGIRMDNTHEWCNKEITPQIDNLKNLSVNLFPWWMEKLRRFEIIHIPRVLELSLEASAEKEILQSQDIQSLIVVPMIYNKYLVGYLGFDSVREERIWPEDIILLLKIVGEILVNALERKQAERKQAEELFKELFDSSPNAIFIVQDGKFKVVNPQFVKESGFSEEELLGIDSLELVYPEDKEIIREIIVKNLKSGLSSPFEYRGIRKSGEVRWALQVVTSINYQGRRAILGNFKDITEIRQVQKELRESYQKLQKTMEGMINTIAKITETRDPYTAGHQLKVSELATAIAREMKLPSDKIEGIRIASLVHDIGKISIPAEILSKPTKLNEIEYSLIKNHSQIGYDILKSTDFPWRLSYSTMKK